MSIAQGEDSLIPASPCWGGKGARGLGAFLLASAFSLRYASPMEHRQFDIDQPDLTSVRQILALRPGAIGDTLLTFPTLRALRERFPGARITIAGNRPALELGRGAGLLDSAEAFGADWVSDLFGDEPTEELKRHLEPYDLAIVWMHSTEAAGDLARVLRAAGVRAVLPALSFPAPGSRRHLADHLRDSLTPIGIGRALAPVLFSSPGGDGKGEGEVASNIGRNWPEPSHVGQGLVPRQAVGPPRTVNQPGRGRGHAPVLHDTDGNAPLRPHPNPLPQERGLAECLLGQFAITSEERDNSPLLILHPGAGARYKRWPAERYAELARRFAAEGWEVAVTAGPADEDAVDAFRTSARDVAPRVLQGLHLNDLAATLARASLVVGNDSGITHLAALVGAPTLALFGPYDPAYWSPIGPRVAVLDAGADCPHRGDPREGCRTCNFLAGLDVQSVWEAAKQLA